MKTVSVKEKIRDFQKNLKLKMLLVKAQKFGFTQNSLSGLMDTLGHQNIELLLKKSSIKEEFYRNIKENLSDYVKYNHVYIMLLLGPVYDVYNFYRLRVPEKKAEAYLEQNYTMEEHKKIIEEYKNDLVEYIKRNSSLRNQFRIKSTFERNDLREDFTLEHFSKIIEGLYQLHGDLSIPDYENYEKMIKLLFDLETIYSKQELFEEKELIKFEIASGYFWEYQNNNQELPPLSERKKRMEEEKKINVMQRRQLKEQDLLVKRLKSIHTPEAEEWLEKIRIATESGNLIELSTILETANDYYEIAYRTQLIQSLYTPEKSTVIDSFLSIKPMLVHCFIRNSKQLLDNYQKITTQQFLENSSRRDPNQLTESEQEELNKRIIHADKILLNPLIANETVNIPGLYTDSSGLRSYVSDTTNQLSTRLIDLKQVLEESNSFIGIGFDKATITEEDIMLSSNQYLTTNMGLNNLEVSEVDEFKMMSASLEELREARLSEVVLSRKNVNSEIKAAYLIITITGNKITDEKIKNQAEKFLNEYPLKLIVLDLPKIKESYQQYLETEIIPEKQNHKGK